MPRLASVLVVVAGCAQAGTPAPEVTVDAPITPGNSPDAPCATRYADTDGDGHGNPAAPSTSCTSTGTVTSSDDCDDTNPARAPGLPEICDGIDNDCSAATVETCAAGCVGRRRAPPDHARVYLFCSNAQVWTTARASCAAAGFTLVQIENEGENAWVVATAQQLLGAVDTHIGANDLAVDTQWRWDGGVQFWQGHWYGGPVGGLYSKWRAGEPNNDEGIEHCGELMWSMSGGGGWNDDNCGDAQRYICRR